MIMKAQKFSENEIRGDEAVILDGKDSCCNCDNEWIDGGDKEEENSMEERDYRRELIAAGVVVENFDVDEEGLFGLTFILRCQMYQNIAWLALKRHWKKLCDAVDNLNGLEVRETHKRLEEIVEEIEDLFYKIEEKADENRRRTKQQDKEQKLED
jgi:hypothetical protein